MEHVGSVIVHPDRTPNARPSLCRCHLLGSHLAEVPSCLLEPGGSPRLLLPSLHDDVSVFRIEFKGRNRVLLVMATGTGKTYTAFQIIWRLWNAGRAKRVLSHPSPSNDVLWAAVTVGRPDVFHVFRHGNASVQEAIFRWSMVRMALQQRGVRGQKLVRTDLFKQMDPTEKGAVNYFLGLLMCKLFASKLLDAPWTLHLDVFRAMLNPRLIGGRSRPDMVAQSASTTQWYAFECKGRASVPGDAEKQKAKAQAQRLVSVNATPCTLQVGAITFFKNDAVEFYWRDPEPGTREPIQISNPDFGWGTYYEPFVQVIRSRGEFAAPGLQRSCR